MIRVSSVQISENEKRAVMQVLDSGHLVQGKKVEEFEKNFCAYVGAKEAVAVSSGTAALHTALYAAGVGKGDEVITTPFTFVATVNAVLMQGATPVFADINLQTFNLDPIEVEKRITSKTKAILVVDLYGQGYDPKIHEIASKHNLLVIEDAAQAVGASVNSKPVGSVSDITTFSFYATKNLVCGEGGMVTTMNPGFAQKCRMFRFHGKPDTAQYDYSDLGYNYRLTDVAAAIGVEQLKIIEDLTERRISNANYFTKNIVAEGVELPFLMPNSRHVFHQYTIKSARRDKIQQKLTMIGIESKVFYPKPLHLCKAFEHLHYKQGDFPNAERASSQVLSIPCHPHLSMIDLNKIVEAINNA